MLPTTPVALNDEFKYALDRMEHSFDHLFITGRAGTGKSTLLSIFKNTTKKRCAFLAPTGVSALHIKGQTIHSFFRFPPKLIDRRELSKRRNHKLYKKVETIVIDEISMVRADMIDAIDIFLQKNREIAEPFGGVQMLFFGDLFQLPPVISNPIERHYLENQYDSPYFFSAHVFSTISKKVETIELHKVFRQTDQSFIKLLDKVRTCTMDLDDLNDLNQRICDPGTLQNYFITLSTLNSRVSRINSRKLEELDSPELTYPGKIQGKFDLRNPPAPLELKIKKGAQIMFVRNDMEKRFVNGTLGIVERCTSSEIRVRVLNENGEDVQPFSVDPEIWEIIQYKYDENTPDQIKAEVIATFEQYPLQLAWAVTIHKSQGKTFDNILIDMASGAFDFGQTYVALSRCRSLEGITLKQAIKPKDIMVDERIVDFYKAWS